ncbi:MAG: iron-containing redox enzyme family protein [Thermoleophilaceae bacterium]
MEFFDRLEEVRTRWNVLEHPFYQRWSRGELTREELGFYAGEYREAVVALAEATRITARACEPGVRAELDEHAAEEEAHVDLWDDFAAAAGAPAGIEPRPETHECTRAWTAAGDALEGLVTLYAIESGQPAISQTKLEGLVEHYGMTPESPATAYFELHSERDHEHAAQSRALIEERLDEADAERLVAAAERVLAGNWALLDGVERRFGR